MDDDDLGDDTWDKIGGAAPNEESGDATADEEPQVIDMGPPVRATFLVRADSVPVAPWPQGWRVGAIGPENGHVTLVTENDIDLSPVAQLSAITGVLGTLKNAQLDVVWWTIQTRGPLELDQTDIDDELQQLLDREPGTGPEDPQVD
ncbi:MAG: hypothetical protein KDC46_13575 [Thermoleophilia bacterium]|nr:hypothetical protein [Thermoleophilia bacterium]